MRLDKNSCDVDNSNDVAEDEVQSESLDLESSDYIGSAGIYTFVRVLSVYHIFFQDGRVY